MAHLPDDCDDALPVMLAQARPARQAQAALGDILRYAAASNSALREDRLQVQRLPYPARLYILRFEREPKLLACRPEPLRVDQKAGEPAIRLPVRGLRHEFNA